MEGRRAAGVCRHPGAAAREGCSVTRESQNEAWRRHTPRMEFRVSARQVLRRDGTGNRADAAARGSISRRAHERGQQTAKWRQSRAGPLHRDQRACGEGAMGRRSGQRAEGVAAIDQGSATQEVLWATACRTKLMHREGPEREA